MEFAPTGFVKIRSQKQKKEEEPDEEIKVKEEVQEKQTRQIFVKNLNFKTVELQLEKLFKDAKIGKVRAVKIVRRSDT